MSNIDTKGNKTQRRNSLTSILSDVGKLLPQAVDVEERILGAVMIETGAILAASEILIPDSFYKDEHKIIFQACLDLFKKSKPIDLTTVTAELRKSGQLETAGRAYYISELTNRVSSSANLEFHSRIVAEKFLLRRMIELSNTIQHDCYDETSDVFNILATLQSGINTSLDSISVNSISTAGDVSEQALQDIETARNNGGVIGHSTGIRGLDAIMKGLAPKDLVIIAGRPGMGKTSLAVCILNFVSSILRIPCGIISLEMSDVQLIMQLYSIQTQINNQRVKVGDIRSDEVEKWDNALKVIKKQPLYIDDKTGPSLLKIKMSIMKMVNMHGVKVVAVDFLQMAHGHDSKKQRNQQIEEVARELKNLAKELGITIIALAQLSRQVEQRGGSKRPILSDLKESGAIEEAADAVIFVYRPEYYNIPEDEEGRPTTGIAELIIAKNRKGPPDTVPVRFIGYTTTFCDIENNPEPIPQMKKFDFSKLNDQDNDEPF